MAYNSEKSVVMGKMGEKIKNKKFSVKGKVLRRRGECLKQPWKEVGSGEQLSSMPFAGRNKLTATAMPAAPTPAPAQGSQLHPETPRSDTSSFSDLFHLITSCDFLGSLHRNDVPRPPSGVTESFYAFRFS